MRTLLGKMLHRQFYREFGFVPTSREVNRGIYIHAAEQAVVDGQLRLRASAYRAADAVERGSAEAFQKVHDAAGLSEACSRLWQCQEGVRRAKDSFWQAHGLAKKAGFTVHDRYTDYLPSEWD